MASHWTENESLLDERTKNISRAIKTLMEEVEAVMFYEQRVSLTSDPELKAVMAHNRDEEIEHAVMSIEWLRRNMDGWDHELRTYLFTSANLLEVEDAAMNRAGGSAQSEGLAIGSLK